MSGERALKLMVKRAKAILRGAGAAIDWNEATWNVTRWLPTRESNYARCLHFALLGTHRSRRIPMPAPFADFAKASTVLLWARSRVRLGALTASVSALRYLLCALERRKSVLPWRLRPDDFVEALAAFKRKGVRDVRQMGHSLAAIALQADRYELTAQPIAFTPSIPRRLPNVDTDPPGLVARAAEEKLPSLDVLAAYAQCTNHPVNDDERILLRATDLHIALGTRIGEALTIPLDCWIQEDARDLDGRLLLAPSTGEPQRRYGIRYYPEKGYDLAVDWLAEQDVPLARRAVSELTVLCARARRVAGWLERHPGRLWAYVPDRHVPMTELIKHLQYANADAFQTAMRHRGVRPVARRRPHDPASDTYYRAGDVEQAFSTSPARLVAVRGAGGKTILKLSEALCVRFDGQFGFTHKVRNYRRPLLITAGDIRRALGGCHDASVFDRRGMTVLDAQGRPQRIHLKTHSTRHWKNALYDVGGMTDLQQSWAMHRKDVRQTRVYQHRTVQEQTDLMRRFQELSHTDKVERLRTAIRDGAVAGPLTEAYRILALNNPTDAEAFLQTYARGIHVTPWGICANDFSLSPCRKYLQCYDNCRYYHRTSDPSELFRLKDLRTKMKMAIEAMRKNAEGEAGADNWVNMLESKLVHLEHALNLAPSNNSTLQVFPQGADRSGVSTVKRAVI